ncbi:MAG: hypothetical protein H0W40_10145 [Methylibium sp.]|uniref:hypothetical protein n=1 Tax=Methylibium sp. TaxID=2067992 RepID=UPI0018597264|nr:hypothetical protein [Methylibium sp.]MBA3597724.1 hypothetical protein [Methylibium sp.]
MVQARWLRHWLRLNAWARRPPRLRIGLAHQDSRVAKVDLDTEMTVVCNEFERGENQPFSLLSQRVNAAAFALFNDLKTRAATTS